MSKRYNTPHRTHIIKTRVTEEEHADFMERLTAYGMSQSEFIRQAITGATVTSTAVINALNDIVPGGEAAAAARSEERRVGKECLRLCRSRWSPYH